MGRFPILQGIYPVYFSEEKKLCIVVVKKAFRYSNVFSYNHLYQPECFYEKRYKTSIEIILKFQMVIKRQPSRQPAAATARLNWKQLKYSAEKSRQRFTRLWRADNFMPSCARHEMAVDFKAEMTIIPSEK
jgi:hypothetical protein